MIRLATILTILFTSTLTLAAESMPLHAEPVPATNGLGPVIVDIFDVENVDTDLSVNRRMAEDFAREAMQEPADRPITKLVLVARTSEGQPQLFWMVRLAGSWKIAYVFANGEQEGITVVEDERTHPLPVKGAQAVGSMK